MDGSTESQPAQTTVQETAERSATEPVVVAAGSAQDVDASQKASEAVSSETSASHDSVTEPAKPSETTVAQTVEPESVQSKGAPQVARAESESQSEAESQSETGDQSEAGETFADMRLPGAIQAAISRSGYTKPSAIQAAMIPAMLEGRDVIAQSQTGSGKTAAFALPVLANLDRAHRGGPQVLVLAPTRELAMQVAKSFETYAGDLKGFRVTAIYGGQDYEPQRRALRNGVSVVVGTPGRVIDHIKRGTLNLDSLNCLVLDEADEMLNMGFLEDVEFVLEQSPDDRQVALFSATMPAPIRRIADRYLTDPHSVSIESKAMTADSIRQVAIMTSGREKMDLLKRVLGAEDTDGVIVFAKTKESTTVVAEKLIREGYAAAALNGDMPQAARQRTVGSLRSGKLDIVVATDVAARGLDVPRISHVINFDLPHDRESYVHRIGRTGRAGRSGEAILFLTYGERGRLRSIEQMTKQKIEIAPWPSAETINQRRIDQFKEQITGMLAKRDVTFFEKLIGQYVEETGKPIEKVAAALAEISRNGQPFLVDERTNPPKKERGNRPHDKRPGGRNGQDRGGQDYSENRGRRTRKPVESGMRRYRVEVGRNDGVRPGNLVGAIANEAGIDSQYIGPIHIDHSFTTVDLPESMTGEAISTLQRTRVMGKALKIRPDTGPVSGGGHHGGGGHGKPRGKGGFKGGHGNGKPGGKKKHHGGKNFGKPKR